MNLINKNEIHLIESTHTYVLESNPDIKFDSATEVIGEYFSKFDSDVIAKKLVSTHEKYIGMSEKELKDQWAAATKMGTDIHKEIEQHLINGKIPTINKSELGIQWIKKYKMKGDLEIFPEVIIYSEELGIAGTVDIITKDKLTGKYEIIDWKTGKYERESYRGKMCSNDITADLMDCKFEKYSLQISLYRYLLEKYYGLDIQNQIIAHIFDDRCEGFVVPYYKGHIEKIINSTRKD